MTLVVADTGPIRYLTAIGVISVLPKLYTRVALPSVVVDELTNSFAPEAVRIWAKNLPEWIEVRTPTQRHQQLELEEGIDPDEAAAILLALELHADRILLD